MSAETGNGDAAAQQAKVARAARQNTAAKSYTLRTMHFLVGDKKVDPWAKSSPWVISDEDIPAHTERILQESDRPDRVRAAEVVLKQHDNVLKGLSDPLQAYAGRRDAYNREHGE